MFTCRLYALCLITLFQSCKITRSTTVEIGRSVAFAERSEDKRSAIDSGVLLLLVTKVSSPRSLGAPWGAIPTHNSKKTTIIQMKIYDKYNVHLRPRKGEKNNSPSQTIAGETYTIRELLIKHSNGIMPQIARDTTYQEDVTHDSLDLNAIKNMDIQERNEIFNLQTDLISEIELKEAERKERANRKSKPSEDATTVSEKAVASDSEHSDVSEQENKK